MRGAAGPFLAATAGFLLLLAAAPASRAASLEKPGRNLLLGDWLDDLRLATRSRSEGQANHGLIQNADPLPLDGRSWRSIGSARPRGTNHGTERLLRLVRAAADSVAEQFPGSLAEVGNISLPAGGQIQQSKSHQAGRDIDVAFYVKDAKGKARATGRFVSVNGGGKTSGGGTIDLARTWRFVRSLIESEDPVVQWIFVSGGVRDLLLTFAREEKAPPELVDRAALILHQPSDSSDHSDHMHIRIYCSEWERAYGCTDYGPAWPHVQADRRIVTEREEWLARRATKGKWEERLAALRKLSALAPEKAAAILEEMACDADARLVEAALELLRRRHPDAWPEILATQVSTCQSPPATRLVLLTAATELRDRRVWAAARKQLLSKACQAPAPCKGKECQLLDRLCVAATRVLGYAGTPADGFLLVKLLQSGSKAVKQQALDSLRLLHATREPVLPVKAGKTKGKKDVVSRWLELVERGRFRSWFDLAAGQLSRQGYRVSRPLASPGNRKELLRAVRAGFPTAYAAQVALAELHGVALPRVLDSQEAWRTFQRGAVAAPPPKPAREAECSLPALPE